VSIQPFNLLILPKGGKMSEVVEKLLEADIDADDYARGPLGNHVFGIGMLRQNDGIIKVWQPKTSDASVYPDKEFRQAVIEVNEGDRIIKSKSVFLRINYRYDFQTKKYIAPTLEDARDRVRNHAEGSVFIPGRRSTRIKNLRWVEQNKEDKGFWVEADVEMRAPASRQTFLVGFDTHYHFVAALRNPVKSVRGAHRELRPAGLKPGYLRQGEWFFNPISKSLAQRIDEYAFSNPGRIYAKPFESRSSHAGKQIVHFEEKMYVVGYVTDSRRGHHEPLYLPEWHEVIRNNEIHVRPTSTRRYWD
jgi:hypothetical protein